MKRLMLSAAVVAFAIAGPRAARSRSLSAVDGPARSAWRHGERPRAAGAGGDEHAAVGPRARCTTPTAK
jgi:hypothetical protein